MININKYTAHKHPGKFEGESAATEYFWEQVMNGDGEDHYPMPKDLSDEDAEFWDGPCYTLFTVDAEESETWPEEFKIGDTVVIWEDSQGFVNMCAYGSRDTAIKFLHGHCGLPL